VNANCDNPSGGSIRLNIIGPREPYQISRNGQTWQPAGGLITGLTAGEYLFSIRNADGCLEQSAYTVTVELDLTGNCDFFYVPTGFTPNGDGLNETLKPHVSPVFREVEWVVYNRFGQRLFVWKPGLPGWNGQHNGMKQPAGTFVWKASYLDVSGKRIMKNGVVQLIR
jgi:gliding motility-associated-like protein